MLDLLSRAAAGVGWFFGGYAGVVVALYGLSWVTIPARRISDLFSFAARVLATFLSVLLCAAFGVVAGVAMRIAGGGRWREVQWMTARAFKYTMMATTGIRCRLDDPHGAMAERPAVFVSNHQSALDLVTLGWMFPPFCSMTAKQSLRHYPVLGWFMQLSGAIFLDRANAKDARAKLSGASDVIRAHQQSVCIFPEGTRSHAEEPVLLPFKKGAFHLAVAAQVPIVPVVAANYSHILSPRHYRFHSGVIPLRGLTASDVTALTERTRDAMMQELLKLTAEARREAGFVSPADSAAATPVTVPVSANNHVAPTDKAVSSGVQVAAS